jgi:hypothetical protein
MWRMIFLLSGVVAFAAAMVLGLRQNALARGRSAPSKDDESSSA